MSERKKILLADDAHLFLELEKTFFRRENFEIFTAENGQDALDAVYRHQPDLAFLDLHMPKLNGDECCRKIKADPAIANIPVVMVTHGGREVDLERCREAGCDAIVLKPINRHQFLSTAMKFLNITERLSPRVGIRMEVQYGADPQKMLTDYSVNISAGGLFIETNDPLPADTDLTLRFTLPNSGEIIECKGRVAWINHPEKIIKPTLAPGLGVQFTDLSIDQMTVLREYIQTQSINPTW